MLHQPFFDPTKSYEENWKEGPFGAFASTINSSERSRLRSDELLRTEGEPKYKVFEHKVYLPFGIPAGPLLNGRFVDAALDLNFDIPMHKTVRTRAKACHPFPNVLAIEIEGDLTMEKASHQLKAKEGYLAPLSITNSFGNPSQDSDIWQRDIAHSVAHARKGQIVAASIEGTKWPGYSDADYIQDWAIGAGLLKEAGAQIIEANLSCPNEGTTSLVCFDVNRARKIAEAIKNKIGNTPLLLKTAYFSDEENLRHFVKELGKIVDGISSINTISAEVVNEKGQPALPGEGRLRSGVCGHAIKWAGLDMVKRLKKLREEFNYHFLIFGGGGVMNPQDYQEYHQAGADVVMSATGAMWNPYLAGEIKKLIISKV
ncbi:dihydroorotate oxidase [Candidatus Azambacteria bacterium]|nr:dihydroorotate oxidase [Candidatus Azambacteria bacterium]